MSDQKTKLLHFSTELEKYKIGIAEHEINQNGLLKNKLSTFLAEETDMGNTLDERIHKLKSESEQCLFEIEQKQERNMSLESNLEKLIEEEKALLNARGCRSENARKVCDFIVQNNKDLWLTIMKLQEKLGIKLKISPISDDLVNRTMKFGFDSNDMNRNYVVIAFDENTKRFLLKEMWPKNYSFEKIARFLDKTNDITGFLYCCNSFYKSFTSNSN